MLRCLSLLCLFLAMPASGMDASDMTAMHGATQGTTKLRGSSKSPALLRQCAESAQSLVRELLPGAERLAGRKLNVLGPDGVLLARIDGAEINIDDEVAYVTFRPNDADGRINVYERTFCRFKHQDRRAVMAHELGHVVDQALTGSLGQPCRMPCVRPPWLERESEVRATAYAFLILRSLGEDGRQVLLHYLGQPAYLERVLQELRRIGALQTAAP